MKQTPAPEPTAVYNGYRQTLAAEARRPSSRWSFKSDPAYREVVEHVTPEQGQAFLDWSSAQGFDAADVVDLALRNDAVGRPIRYPVGPLGLEFSPSNWRYLCHAIKVRQHLDRLGIDRAHIIELGGGYGGLAHYCYGLFRERLESYAIVDLPEAIAIQRQYALAMGFPLYVANGLDGNALQRVMPMDRTTRVFVSCYAFSEFSQDMRDWYADRLIARCDHGLVIWNFPEAIMGLDGKLFGGPVYPFTTKPISSEPDLPALYVGHQLVTF